MREVAEETGLPVEHLVTDPESEGLAVGVTLFVVGVGLGTVQAARRAVARVQSGPGVIGYVTDLARATRVSPSFQLGVSPRGSTALLNTAKAWAWLNGRDFTTPDDVQAMTLPCLRHRVSLRPEAELDGVSADQVLSGLLATVPVPR